MERDEFIRDVLPLRETLVAYARRMPKGMKDAEDVVQEVFLKLWHMRGELKRYKSVQALAVQITKHLCLNRFKVSERRREELPDKLPESEVATPYQRLEEKDQVEFLMRVIDHLPTLQQAILRMRHLDGMEVEEIAALTGCSPEATRMNLSRARKKVKEIFYKLNK